MSNPTIGTPVQVPGTVLGSEADDETLYQGRIIDVDDGVYGIAIDYPKLSDEYAYLMEGDFFVISEDEVF